MKTLFRPIILTILGLSSVSCVYDKPDYHQENCAVYLAIRSADSNDAQINDMAVYIYNSSGSLVGYHTTNTTQEINLEPYLQYGVLKIVAWGNVLSGTTYETLSKPTLGSSINNHTLTQLPTGASFNGKTLTQTPTDLFHGTIELNFTKTKNAAIEATTVKTMLIERKVSSYRLSVNGIGKTLKNTNNDYRVVFYHPYSGLDFAGNPVGEKSYYLPSVNYDPITDQLTTAVNIALPTGNGSLTIELFSGGKSVYTTNVDNQGNMITLSSNKLQNIFIDLTREGDLSLILSNWGEVVIDQGFGTDNIAKRERKSSN